MIKLAAFIDPIASLNFSKDTTLALLFEAQSRGFELNFFEQQDLYFHRDRVYAKAKTITLENDPQNWCTITKTQDVELGEFDIVLLRKDPPFDTEYLTSTYLLDHATQHQSVKIVNHPKAVRDANEKLFATWFSDLMPETMVTSSADLIKTFLAGHEDIIVKPLYAMGGYSIFRLTKDNPNVDTVLELMTNNGQISIMAQAFIPEIQTSGDLRVIVINGEVIPYGLARKPAIGSIRGNLAAGGHGEGVILGGETLEVCNTVAKELVAHDIFFAGIDLIGNKLTEVNVTSPTCVREIEQTFDIDIKKIFFDQLGY